jgi:hypothetical protein
MKLRTTQSFKDAITRAREVFGTPNNSTTEIVRRALRSFRSDPFAFDYPQDKTSKNPVTMNVKTNASARELQGITIAYINIQIDKKYRCIKAPLVLDASDNYVVE